MALTRATPDQILAIAVDEFGITIDDLRARTRASEIVEMRRLTANLLFGFTDLSLREIGQILGRDRMTISYHVEHFDASLQHGWGDLYQSAAQRIRRLAA